MLFPLIMNALQYYIIDSFIKMKEGGHERVPTEEARDHDPFDDALAEDSDDEGSTSGESSESMRLENTKFFKNTNGRSSRDDREEYDPDRDGTTKASAAGGLERGSLLNKELVPPE